MTFCERRADADASLHSLEDYNSLGRWSEFNMKLESNKLGCGPPDLAHAVDLEILDEYTPDLRTGTWSVRRTAKRLLNAPCRGTTKRSRRSAHRNGIGGFGPTSIRSSSAATRRSVASITKDRANPPAHDVDGCLPPGQARAGLWQGLFAIIRVRYRWWMLQTVRFFSVDAIGVRTPAEPYGPNKKVFRIEGAAADGIAPDTTNEIT
jgi:hypothetical protein